MATLAELDLADVGETPFGKVEPSAGTRLAAAIAIGIASALFTAFVFSQPHPPDFAAWYRGAQVLLSGANPYRLPLLSTSWPFDEPLYYPLPTLLVTLPLAKLSLPVAGALFMGISGALLAWLVSRDGLWRLWLFGTASYLMACRLGQWSPLLTAVTFLPAAGILAVMKPNLGLAILAYRPTVRAIIGCIAIGLLSFAILPSWLADWHANLASVIAHPAPIATTGGPILLLALLRWRRPEARLLLVMACVPQLLFWADQLPLFLIPRSKPEMMAMVFVSTLAFLAWFLVYGTNRAYVLAAEPFVFWGVYVPCLVMILRRPNAAD